MKVSEALPLLEKACGRKFGELFAGHPEDLRTNKGNVGQLLLVYIGLKLDCELCDFDDGELKTNKALPNGQPLETIFITQISKIIDTLVGENPLPFEKSNLYKKIRNIVYLPVVKQSANASDWYFVRVINIELDKNPILFNKLKQDYETICAGLTAHIENNERDKLLHTTNGQHYIQVRTKDSKPYHSIYSQKYERKISDKNFAFYFLKAFMKDAVEGKI